MDKKKTLILSILGVIVLVIAVVGISYAMYTFTGTGTKENVITTGKISVSYGETNTITLTETYSATDAYGSQTSETLDFSVVSQMDGETAVAYDVQLLVDEDEATGGLKDDHVDISIKKNADYLHNTGASVGLPLSTWAETNGTIITSGGYVVANGNFAGDGTDTYQIKAWVNDTYELPTTDTSEENTHANQTTYSTLTFKVKVQAKG